MKKILKIQFWKAEKALAMQILEQEGLPRGKEEGFVRINDVPWFYDRRIDLRGHDPDHDWDINRMTFDTNVARDGYLQEAVKAITNELFTGKGKLEAGEMCEVWDPDSKKWQERRLLAVLPENYEKGFIVADLDEPNRYVSFPAARPFTKRTEPKIEKCGDIVTYTWKE